MKFVGASKLVEIVDCATAGNNFFEGLHTLIINQEKTIQRW